MAAGYLDRSRIVALPGWSRWLVPPAALSIHLAIGQAYAWSVFKKPLEISLGISGVASALPFTLGIVMLGLSAALFGTRVDSNGPRWAMFISMCCFCSGFLISAVGVSTRQYWLVILGYGVVGGIGLGIGYISPVSTLIKWFPDRPGLATGIAIMGFGGGALIAAPWSNSMLTAFGAIGAQPDPGGYSDFFPSGTGLAAAAAGFVAILSLANMLGRFAWSSTSDVLGRKNIYRMYLGVGALLYLAVTLTTNANKVVFLLCCMLILSFYGAGFATVPAYLRDLFGTYQVGAIHGRLLTAWSTAGVLGPVIVNAIADARIAAGVTGPGRYTLSFLIMIGLLIIGFVCNELIRPVNPRFHEPVSERAAGKVATAA
ncbi:MAG: MFS transporter [Actinomycetota bacterium]|nr:MFS transporter [Actinomycetota bacterium]